MNVLRNLEDLHNVHELSAATDWVDAATAVDASQSIAEVLGQPYGRPIGVVCDADGDLTMVSEQGNSRTITATASVTPLPYSPYRITAVTGTFTLLY